jgi:hypothetical protein
MVCGAVLVCCEVWCSTSAHTGLRQAAAVAILTPLASCARVHWQEINRQKQVLRYPAHLNWASQPNADILVLYLQM